MRIKRSMNTLEELKKQIAQASFLEKMKWLYCCDAAAAEGYAARYLDALNRLEETFGAHKTAALFSAPGRTEIGGNHTDHQHGRVLAGSVNIDMIAAVGPNDCGQLRLKSEGYERFSVDLTDIAPHPGEENTTVALVRGICAAFRQRGAVLRGLDVYVSSNVPKGSGVSSSAAFEVLVGTVLNELFMNGGEKVLPIAIAQIGQWAENVYFGKPCGLMDQMASSVGGVVGIDFADPAQPVVAKIDFDLAGAGLALCILDSGADHADLTEEYAAVPAECTAVAKVCGGSVLREVPYERFLEALPQCRAACSDRAVLRAFHFYGDNERVEQQAAALATGDYDRFLQLVNESGHSSWEYLQNVTPIGAVAQQAVGLTIAVAREALGGRGAVRVHGGGFAGTVQAFVPLDMVERFQKKVEAVLGEHSCHVMDIRPVGGIRVA